MKNVNVERKAIILEERACILPHVHFLHPKYGTLYRICIS